MPLPTHTQGLVTNLRNCLPSPSWIDAVNKWALDLRGAMLLFGMGKDINAKDNSGMTALHFASRSRKTTIVGLLLGLGADVNARDKSGKTALHHAADGWYGSKESSDKTLSILLERMEYDEIMGHCQNDDINTALHFAFLSEDVSAIRVLRRHGADLNTLKVNGEITLDLAKEDLTDTDLRKVIAQILVGVPARSPNEGG